MAIISKAPTWLAAKVGDEVLMMSADMGRYIGLNPVGARIWDLLDVPQDRDRLVDTLVAEFDVAPETCAAEVDAFLGELAKHHAITIDAAPAQRPA